MRRIMQLPPLLMADVERALDRMMERPPLPPNDERHQRTGAEASWECGQLPPLCRNAQVLALLRSWRSEVRTMRQMRSLEAARETGAFFCVTLGWTPGC